MPRRAGCRRCGDTSLDVVADDFDGDGDVDLLFANHGQQDRLYLNDGTGTFVDASATHMPVDAANSVNLALGDVDGDGVRDLVIGVEYGGPTRLYLGSRTGAFTDATSGRLPPSVGAMAAVALGDLDDDGDLDLVLGSHLISAGSAGELRALVNSGTGVFSDATAGLLGTRYDGASALALADLDADGDVDIARGYWVKGGGATPCSPDPTRPDIILLNRLRQLRTPDLLKLGEPYRVEVHAVDASAVANLAIPAMSSVRQTLPIPASASSHSTHRTSSSCRGLRSNRAVAPASRRSRSQSAQPRGPVVHDPGRDPGLARPARADQRHDAARAAVAPPPAERVAASPNDCHRPRRSAQRPRRAEARAVGGRDPRRLPATPDPRRGPGSVRRGRRSRTHRPRSRCSAAGAGLRHRCGTSPSRATTRPRRCTAPRGNARPRRSEDRRSKRHREGSERARERRIGAVRTMVNVGDSRQPGRCYPVTPPAGRPRPSRGQEQPVPAVTSREHGALALPHERQPRLRRRPCRRQLGRLCRQAHGLEDALRGVRLRDQRDQLPPAATQRAVEHIDPDVRLSSSAQRAGRRLGLSSSSASARSSSGAGAPRRGRADPRAPPGRDIRPQERARRDTSRCAGAAAAPGRPGVR